MLIVFIGPRGVGKSTQINKISEQLKAKNTQVRITHIKTGIILGHLAATVLTKIFIGKSNNESSLTAIADVKPHLFKKTFRFWIFLDILVVSTKLLLEVKIFEKLGYIVLTEDFIPSIVSDYVYLAKLSNIPLSSMSLEWKILYKLTKRNADLIIFLDGEKDALKIRRAKRGDFDKRGDFLPAQRFTLKSISKNSVEKARFLYIDTTQQSVLGITKIINAFMKSVENS